MSTGPETKRALRPGIIVCEDYSSLSTEAARVFSSLSAESIERRGLFAAAVSGGRTPEGFFETLSMEQFKGSIDWGRTHLFWADERCVPPIDKESNYGRAYELFIGNSCLPEANIHRIKGEDGEKAAKGYEEEIRRFFRLRSAGFPEFDLVILGLGLDGHIASLFPGDEALKETERIAVYVPPSGPRTARVTLTVGAINNSRNAVFLVSGREKTAVFKEVTGGHPGTKPAPPLPASLIRPKSGNLIWIVDKAAYGA